MDWMRYRLLYFAASVSVLLIGIFSLIFWGINFGADFTGGAAITFRFGRAVSEESLLANLRTSGLKPVAMQSIGENSYVFRFPPVTTNEREKVKDLVAAYDSEAEELSFENIGPSIGKELIKKTIYALAVASLGILAWVTLQFKSLKFGVSAIIATLHDSLVLISIFLLFGGLAGAELDFLFVTAMLTTLSFSVHDTIVVYDRIRETSRKYGYDLYQTANRAISETMVRSLNNSLTIIFVLVSLSLLGGSSIRWFAVALLVGTISGTYSSPFVAVPLLVTWDAVERKVKK